MTYYARDVERFQEKFGLPTPASFRFLPDDLHDFRVKFFNEELDEYLQSYRENDLATAVDSLIDLVYITCGAALLHGIPSNNFHLLMGHVADPQRVYSYDAWVEQELPKYPQLLETIEHAQLARRLQKAIEDYENAHVRKSRPHIETSLAHLYVSCLKAAEAMGFSEKAWNELWDDVQRANMTKERAERKGDARSKRGSGWDIVKPKGWQPPDTAGILQKYLKS